MSSTKEIRQAEAFLRRLGRLDQLDRDAVEAIGATLAHRIAAARASWPGLGGSDTEFMAHLADCASGADDPGRALESMHVDDLLVAWRAGCGDQEAIAEVRAILTSEIAAFGRRSNAPMNPGEVQSILESRMVVGEEARGPRIHQFAGRGSLRSWLRVAIAREVSNTTRRGPREILVDDDYLATQVLELDSPEIELVRKRCLVEFRAAFVDAIGGLTSRQRTLLRLSILDRVGIDQLATIYSVHRSTVARWIGSAKEQLAAAIKTNLRDRLSASVSEIDSLLRVVQSQIDLTLERYLASTGDGGGAADEPGSPAED